MAERFEVLATAETAADMAASLMAEALKAGIKASGVASLAVSGGRTPVLTFKRLSKVDIDWSHIVVTLVDERWVDPASQESNERLVRDNLLVGQAKHARFVPMKTDAPTPAQGLASFIKMIGSVPTPLDAVLLGMGEDGHFASLFPGSSALSEGLNTPNACVAVPQGQNGAAPTQARLSLSLSLIAHSRKPILLTGGAAKYEVLTRALSTEVTHTDLPIAALFACRPDITILHSRD